MQLCRGHSSLHRSLVEGLWAYCSPQLGLCQTRQLEMLVKRASRRLEERTKEVSLQLTRNSRFTAKFVAVVSDSFHLVWKDSGCADFVISMKVSDMWSSAGGFLECMRDLTEASQRRWLLMCRYAAVENSFMIPRWKFAWEADGGVYGEGYAKHLSHRAYALLQMLKKMSANSRPDEPLLMVELGVCMAATSEALLKRMPGLRMILVDRVIFPAAKQRTQAYANRTTWINDLGAVASSKVADGSADLVFIDAAHDYESVQEDLLHWASKVRPGGILAGHDYLTASPGLLSVLHARL
ncbi:unnamed protein product [Symbiodinium sp. CCMP2592]|nr:unnamed protein product [Symbiodinium sp. CCMP2592]